MCHSMHHYCRIGCMLPVLVHHIWGHIMSARMDETYLVWLDSAPISSASRETYTRRLKAFLDWLWETKRLNYDQLLTNADFARHAHWYREYLLKGGMKTNTLNTSMTSIDKYMNFRTLGHLNYTRVRAEDVAPRALTPKELKTFLWSLEQSKSLRNKALVLVLLHTGIRLGEVAALKLSDVRVSRTRGTIAVRCGKGMRRREVPLNGSVRNILLEYIPALRADLARRSKTAMDELNQPFWFGQNGKKIGTRNIDYIIRAIGDRVNLNVSAHVLRHTFCTRAVRGGIDIAMVADWAGHSRVETTRRYAKPTKEDKAAAIEKLNIDVAFSSGETVQSIDRARKRSKARA